MTTKNDYISNVISSPPSYQKVAPRKSTKLENMLIKTKKNMPILEYFANPLEKTNQKYFEVNNGMHIKNYTTTTTAIF